jgi:hypothetical protein
MIGVRADGRKELVALADGFRESAESWVDLPRDCKRHGMRAPMPAWGTRRWGSGRPGVSAESARGRGPPFRSVA